MIQIKTISISKFKATCLAVLANVKRTGRSILVTRRGEPMGIIHPPPPPEKRVSWLGAYQNKGKITGDILSPVVKDADWQVLDG